MAVLLLALGRCRRSRLSLVEVGQEVPWEPRHQSPPVVLLAAYVAGNQGPFLNRFFLQAPLQLGCSYYPLQRPSPESPVRPFTAIL